MLGLAASTDQTPSPGPRQSPPREARLVALAIHFDRLIREGAVGSHSEIARLTGTSPVWITVINFSLRS